MCGIAGILNFRGKVDPVVLDHFTDSLAHRGPDGRGIFIDNSIGLGHRRLAILDLSDAGKCPMAYGGKDGKRYWITYNGEIYNFLELRNELKKLGYTFRTETDTEVILASYAKWGKDCLLRFNGMWAFAIWDSTEQKLFIARDRFGIKPLYYATTPEHFIFASEIKAFLELKDFPIQLNNNVIPQIIQNSYSHEGSANQTPMKNVLRLPAGHCINVLNNSTYRLDKWWETADHIPHVPERYEDQVERFRELFIDAVRIRMRSDVAIGTCLSGGLDSSAVASSMSMIHLGSRNEDLERCPKDWQQTFIATFPGTNIDEKEYADEVVQHTNSKPHYWIFDEHDALNHIIDSVWAMEDIYGGIAVPVWCLYRELRRNKVVVSLDGHGGDELLGGYTWYLDWPMNKVNQNLYSDFHYTLLPAILRNYDRCSMAHGIEVRMPFMDWRLVTFAFGLTPESKFGGGFTKRILRDSMNGIMPEKVRRRINKIGFNSPMIEWFNGGMKPLIEKIVNHKFWLESPYWNGRLLRNQILEKTNANAWCYNDWGLSLHIWTLMNIVLWQLLFVEKDLRTIRE
jgi:asparagine synthase (glutamine-hydrolysing)